MSTQLLNTKNRPRMNIPSTKPMSGTNSVRVYRSSPEDVMLQLRLETRYASVALSFAEAKELAERLLLAAKENAS